MSTPFPPAPPSSSTNASTNPFPKMDVPLTDNGMITPAWGRLLVTMWQKIGGSGASAIVSVPVGASPFAYSAGQPGTVVVQGGTVSAVTLTRAGTPIVTGLTQGCIPVRSGDTVTITYSAVPTVSLLPL